MSKVSKVPLADSTAEVLRQGLSAGRWQGKLPGQHKLAEELGVSRRTLGTALARLVEEGRIAAAGSGKVPVILRGAPAETGPMKPRSLRVAVLTLIPLGDMLSVHQLIVLRILMDLQHGGHHGLAVSFPRGISTHKTGYLRKIVKENPADAWLVFDGTEEVLSWFVESGLPAMALGGRSRGLRISAVGSSLSAFTSAILDKLIGLGHRRIVLISPDNWRHPKPSSIIVEFRRRLSEVGVHPGEYHTPEWDETPEGLEKLLDELFRVTPPTAILCWAPYTTYGVQAWVKEHGVRVPQDISIASILNDIPFKWYSPKLRITCSSKDANTLFHSRIRKWVRAVATGKNNITQTDIPLGLDEGDSIGPPKAR